MKLFVISDVELEWLQGFISGIRESSQNDWDRYYDIVERVKTRPVLTT